MKNKFFAVLTASAVFVSTFALTSCNKINEYESGSEELTANSYEAVEISEIPTKSKDILKLFNKSFENAGTYACTYTKNIKREINDINVDTFSNIPNAVEAFKMMLGERNVSYYFDKEKSKKDFSGFLPKSELSQSDVSSAKAVQKDNSVYITVQLENVTNPYSDDSISDICGDYMSNSSIKDEMEDFDVVSQDSSVSISDITAVLQINKETSKIEKYTITFNEQFTLTDVTLQDITGKNVTAKSSVKIEYNNFS